MAARRDDPRGRPNYDATRVERAGSHAPPEEIVDDESFADTEVYVGRRHDSVTKLREAAIAARREAVAAHPATVRESVQALRATPGAFPPRAPPARAPAREMRTRGPLVSEPTPLGQTVNLARSPLDDQGWTARYITQGSLGEGGMGTIGLTRDLRIGRDVAMKALRREAASPDSRVRFEREARVQGQLEHPAIVPVYDLGMRPDGLPFFTMKRLRGETLANIMAALQKGDAEMVAKFPRRRLLTAYCQVCLAVAFANSRGVLHRDLKPGNVMLGDFGEVYVLDWGLAKITGEGASDDSILPSMAHTRTMVGEVMGTPGYMSPEQLRGEVDQLDARSDVYTLGVVLFEMLTLEPLHDRSGLDTMYNSTLGKLDQRLSERAHKKGMPPELCAVCIRATALEPKERYASVRELHDAVERFLEGHQDVRARQEMAARHAKTAVEAALLAPRAPEMRELAIRELSAALTLDPTHAGAAETLTRLLVEAPPEMSADARRAFAEAHEGTLRASRRGLVGTYAVWACFLPLVFALGVRDAFSAAVTGALVLLAAISAYLYARGSLGQKARFAIYAVGSLAIASSCTLMGWAIVLPGLAAVHTVGFMLYGDRRQKGVALALGVLSVVLPFALQESGLLSEAYAFSHGKMQVLPHMTALPPVRTQVYLLLVSLGAIVAPAVAISRMRDALEAAEERAFKHAWTLSHLVPGRARDAAAALAKAAAEGRNT